MEPQKEKRQFEYALDRNKPKIIYPILNTLFALVISITLIVIAIRDKQSIWVYFIILLFLIIFPLSSWYNSYFSKKVSRKRIYNVQEETKLMMDYTSYLYPKTKYLLNEESHLNFHIDYVDKETETKISFNQTTKEFEPFSLKKNKNLILLSLGVSFAGIAIDPKQKKVIGVMGLVPCSIWIRKTLCVPEAKTGKVFVDFKDYKVDINTLFQYRKKEDIYYDSKKGWLCFGSRKSTQLDMGVQIAKDVILVIRDNDLISLWVKIGNNIVFR